jgi:hypothetical protein
MKRAWLILLFTGVAAADPGLDPTTDAQPLRIVDGARAEKCKAICLQPGARTTVAVATTDKPTEKSPRFERAAQVAAASGAPAHPAAQAWTLDLAARLKRAALAGNTLFVFYDLADPQSVKNHENTALFQAPVKAGRQLAAHLSLSPEDGFQPGHTYRLRIVQLLGGHEVLLQETDFTLL